MEWIIKSTCPPISGKGHLLACVIKKRTSRWRKKEQKPHLTIHFVTQSTLFVYVMMIRSSLQDDQMDSDHSLSLSSSLPMMDNERGEARLQSMTGYLKQMWTWYPVVRQILRWQLFCSGQYSTFTDYINWLLNTGLNTILKFNINLKPNQKQFATLTLTATTFEKSTQGRFQYHIVGLIEIMFGLCHYKP